MSENGALFAGLDFGGGGEGGRCGRGLVPLAGVLVDVCSGSGRRGREVVGIDIRACNGGVGAV